MGRPVGEGRAGTPGVVATAMIWRPTSLPGVLLGELSPTKDERGHFARIYCRQAFAEMGIDFQPSQISVSYNCSLGTLRGMHFQRPPAAERKLVRCTAGRVFDVLVDLRPDSPCHRQWLGVMLSTEEGNAVFIPEGVAHGFLSLSADATLEYMIDAPYVAELASGVRWDDPAFAIDWPAIPQVISERDRAWPDYAG